MELSSLKKQIDFIMFGRLIVSKEVMRHIKKDFVSEYIQSLKNKVKMAQGTPINQRTTSQKLLLAKAFNIIKKSEARQSFF